MTKEKACISLDPAVKRAVQQAKGPIPLSIFVNDVLWQLFVATDEQIEAINSFN